MRCRMVFLVAAMLLLAGPGLLAQQGAANPSDDVAFWVAHWAQPRVVLFGPEQEAFNKNMNEIRFPWDDSSGPSNPSVLDDNVQWLQAHPSVRFYIEGYSSSRGELIYNLALSQRRANWVKETLVSKGIPENRIVLAVGWGQLYPVCPELNDECWSKNRLVRFSYSPD
jgi:outer membrane protein OmpA-like peptidoglycan-associated protein